MKASFDEKFSIGKLNNSHNRQLFSCGISSLDDYLHKLAGQDKRKRISVTYVLNDTLSSKIAGYYTLSSTTIELTDLSNTFLQKLPHYPLLPATLIGRLAIDSQYQKQGLGELLLIDALRRANQISQEVASFAVIVEALNDNVLKFYQKYNFIPFTSHRHKLYLPMKLIDEI